MLFFRAQSTKAYRGSGSHGQLFRPYYGSSAWHTAQQKDQSKNTRQGRGGRHFALLEFIYIYIFCHRAFGYCSCIKAGYKIAVQRTTILSNKKGHFGPTDRNDQTGQSRSPSKVVPNIPVGLNRKGPFHLISNWNFRNFELNVFATPVSWLKIECRERFC